MISEQVLLGNTTINVSTVRTRRYKLLNIVKSLVQGAGMKHRVSNCMHLIHSSSVDIKQKASGKAYYSGVSVCGSVWVCPVCASRISNARRDELGLALSGNNFMPVMASITLQHYRNDDLKMLTGVLNDALRKLKQGRWWKEFTGRYGIKAYVSSLEITFSLKHGWHPHKHVLFFLDVSSGKPDIQALKDELIGRYTSLVREKGMYASEFHSIDVTACGDDISGYISKWGLMDELAKANIKMGKSESYSPFQLVELAGAGEAWAVQAFREYVHATSGKKQLTWSHGARKVLGLDKEKSDKELAKVKESKDDEIILSLDREQWKQVLRHGLQGELLDVAEQGGTGAVICFLSGLAPPG